MKKLTLLLLVAILLTACGPAPQSVANSWQAALNKGDIDAALSFLAEDAVVTISPAGPEGDAIFTGHAEIRGWYETLTAGKGITTLSNCKVDGETITCKDVYSDDGLKAMGVDFLEGEWVATIQDGKIQAYTFVTSPASLAKLAPPPTPTTAPTEPPVVAPTNPPLPTPTLAPGEALASSVDDLVGKWWFSQAGVTIEFRADGTVHVYSGSGTDIETQDEGTYTFDAGKVTWEKSRACSGQFTTYEVYVTKQDGNRTWLRFQVLGSDPCKARAEVLSGRGKFQNP